MIQNQNFGSIEEVNEFLRRNVNDKTIDELVPMINSSQSVADKANDLMFEAYDAMPAKGKKLAKEALRLHPQNVRALNFLAIQEKSPEGALKLYQKAVEYGKEQLGEKFFRENKGHFWLLVETQPYMTARLGFANCLEALDWHNEVINEYNEILELNPCDHQCVRYMLASLLLCSGKYKAFNALYKKFKDDKSAFWMFNYALYLFAIEGATEKANIALYLANQENTHIIQVMVLGKKLKQNPERYYSPGDENEAAYYLMDNFRSWLNVDNTLDWLNSFIEKNKRIK